MNYQTHTSTIAENLAEIYPEFENEWGFGPCGAYSALKREEGWGDVAVCTAHTAGDDMGFSHYVIISDGIIDMSNPLDEELTYTNIEILNADEMPDLVDAEVIDWLRERI